MRGKQRRDSTPTLAQLKRDPECSYLLCAARETTIPELSEEYRKTAARVWQEKHPSPSRELSPIRVSVPELYGTGTTPEGELEEDSSPHHETTPTQEQLEQDPVCAAQLAVARESLDPERAELFCEGTLSSLRVGSCIISATQSTPETGFLQVSEQEDEEEGYPPSICDASTVDYGGEGEEAYPPSVSDASTVDYSEEDEKELEEDDYLPPPMGPSPTVEEGGEEEEDYPPSECSAHTAEYGEVEEDSYTEEEEDSPPPPLKGVRRGVHPPIAPARAQLTTPGVAARSSPWSGAGGQRRKWTLTGNSHATRTGRLPAVLHQARTPAALHQERMPATLHQTRPPAALRPVEDLQRGQGGTAHRSACSTSSTRSLPPHRSPPGTCYMFVCPCVMCLPVCVPNPFYPFVPLCVNVPVCVFVNVPFNVSNAFSPVFPGRVF
ncbi:uncharacterized protein LOC143500421 [Brachyhypopomus gauderio]|uniref:uncharacterized protein LOC143500421 n=1 Tax=Brachyhypopomus gauderio TaxID=698409 RepID=UPI00404279C7